jgi:hypothetical protein
MIEERHAMSTFRITIETENAAFYDDDGTHNPAPEVALILVKLATAVMKGTSSGKLHDSNGNLVGRWEQT